MVDTRSNQPRYTSLKRSASHLDRPEDSERSRSPRRAVTPAPIAMPALNTMLRVILKHAAARLPVRSSPGAAGYDLCSAVTAEILPMSRGLVNTGLVIQVPHGTYGRIAPRSGLTLNHFIDIGAGVVDEDYRGELKVILFNFGDTPFAIQPGDRIAQLVLERIETPPVVEVQDLPETSRGQDGFGSSGWLARKLSE